MNRLLSLNAVWGTPGVRLAPLLLSAVLLSACGGGGGSSPTPPPPALKHGSIQFDGNTTAVATEGDGKTVTFTVARSDGSDGAVSVAINRSGSATEGADGDYTLSATTVSFAAGDTASKTVTVTIADDSKLESEESLTLTLSAPTGGATIGAKAAATSRIIDNDVLAAPKLDAVSADIKQLKFQWSSVEGATRYRLLEKIDADSDFEPVDHEDVTATSLVLDIPVHGVDWVNTVYAVQACSDTFGCSDPSNPVGAADVMLAAIGYIKASNTGALDEFAASIALSADGSTLAVGASDEDGGGPGGANTGDQGDSNTKQSSGAVYVFARDDQGQWTQQAYVKAGNLGAGDSFGRSVALSGNGNVLAVGAIGEDGSSTGVTPGADGGGSDSKLHQSSGAAYVFTRDDQAQWTQRAYVKASNTGALDSFGFALALSADGSTLAVGAPGEDGGTNQVNGPDNNLKGEAGAVYVFASDALGDWKPQAYVKALNSSEGSFFGNAVALSADGSTLAVGALGEDLGGTGVNNPSNTLATDSGAVYVFTRDAEAKWSQQAYAKASNTGEGDEFGNAVALSADGNTLAVGAAHEDSTGLNGDQGDGADVVQNSGAVYVFTRSDNGVWSQQAYVKPPFDPSTNLTGGDSFGTSLALSGDGNVLAVGATGEDSSSKGIDGIQLDSTTNGTNSGGVHVFALGDDEWLPVSYVKAPNTGNGDAFGGAVVLDNLAETLAVGALGESSNARGVSHDPQGQDQANDDSGGAGAVYLY